MQILNDIQGITKSAKQSAAVSLNAARDAYVWQEAKRKGNEEDMLQKAAKIYRIKHGCSVLVSYAQVCERVKYLEELATGDSTFHQAKEQLSISNTTSEHIKFLPIL